jgi:peptidoglycan/LPS O-acetylase OafA/YrhL
VAAVSVLLCHALYFSFPRFRDFGAVWGKIDLFLAAFGVTLFFVLSGFLMGLMARTMPAGRFLTHRVARIYPIYWIVTAAVLIGRALLGSPAATSLAALALSPGPGRPFVLLIQWTLQFEIAFYLVVAAAIALGLGRRIGWVALVWLAAILVARVALPTLFTDQPPVQFMLINTRCAPFALGLLIPDLIDRVKLGALALPAGALAIVLGLFLRHDFSWPMGFGFALVVAWTASQDLQGRGQTANGVTAFGDWSYGLYLIHAPVVMAVTGMPIARPLAFALAILLPIAACIPVGVLDVRLHKRLREIADSWPRASLAFSGLILGAFLFA